MKRVVFNQKGGVGKSTVSAAMALLAAQQGQQVLLISADGRGDIAALFEKRPVGFRPQVVFPGLSAMAMDTEAALQEYLRLNLRVPIPGRIGPLAKVFDFVATAAPGVKEILTIGKICWEVRESLEDELAYTTVLWVLQTLESKGYVRHEKEGRAYRYHPLIEQEAAGGSALNRMVDRVFQGSAAMLLAQLVAERQLPAEEMERMRDLLDRRLAEEGDQ